MSAGCFSRTPYSDPLATCVTGRTTVDRSTVNTVAASPTRGNRPSAPSATRPQCRCFIRRFVGAAPICRDFVDGAAAGSRRRAGERRRCRRAGPPAVRQLHPPPEPDCGVPPVDDVSPPVPGLPPVDTEPFPPVADAPPVDVAPPSPDTPPVAELPPAPTAPPLPFAPPVPVEPPVAVVPPGARPSAAARRAARCRAFRRRLARRLLRTCRPSPSFRRCRRPPDPPAASL